MTAGLVRIIPTSVTNTGGSASISANGTVTVSGVTVALIQGMFTAAYDNYMVLVSQIVNNVGGATGELRLSAGSTPASGANYTFQRMQAGTVIDGARSTGATAFFGPLQTNVHRSAGAMFFYRPNLAETTIIRSLPVAAQQTLDDIVCFHSVSTAYDGIRWNTGGTYNVSFRMDVYGLAE